MVKSFRRAKKEAATSDSSLDLWNLSRKNNSWSVQQELKGTIFWIISRLVVVNEGQ
jgi:hypothetical protein